MSAFVNAAGLGKSPALLVQPSRFLLGRPLGSSFCPAGRVRTFGTGKRMSGTAAKVRMLAEGDVLPLHKELMVLEDGKPKAVTLGSVLKGKKAVVFAIPGALTPTCQEQHFPGYVDKYDELKAKGVDEIVCLSVNDPFVNRVFAQKVDMDGKVTLLGDGDASLVKGLGIAFDTGTFGGWRARRMSMIVDNGVVSKLNLEEGGGFDGPAKVETILSQL